MSLWQVYTARSGPKAKRRRSWIVEGRLC